VERGTFTPLYQWLDDPAISVLFPQLAHLFFLPNTRLASPWSIISALLKIEP